MSEEFSIIEFVEKTIRKVGNKWCVFSKKSGKNLGCGSSKKWAKKRIAQVEFFKRQHKSLTDEGIAASLDEGSLNVTDVELDKFFGPDVYKSIVGEDPEEDTQNCSLADARENYLHQKALFEEVKHFPGKHDQQSHAGSIRAHVAVNSLDDELGNSIGDAKRQELGRKAKQFLNNTFNALSDNDLDTAVDSLESAIGYAEDAGFDRSGQKMRKFLNELQGGKTGELSAEIGAAIKSTAYHADTGVKTELELAKRDRDIRGRNPAGNSEKDKNIPPENTDEKERLPSETVTEGQEDEEKEEEYRVKSLIDSRVGEVVTGWSDVGRAVRDLDRAERDYLRSSGHKQVFLKAFHDSLLDAFEEQFGKEEMVEIIGKARHIEQLREFEDAVKKHLPGKHDQRSHAAKAAGFASGASGMGTKQEARSWLDKAELQAVEALESIEGLSESWKKKIKQNIVKIGNAKKTILSDENEFNDANKERLSAVMRQVGGDFNKLTESLREKHLPGEHDQQAHAGMKGSVGKVAHTPSQLREAAAKQMAKDEGISVSEARKKVGDGRKVPTTKLVSAKNTPSYSVSDGTFVSSLGKKITVIEAASSLRDAVINDLSKAGIKNPDVNKVSRAVRDFAGVNLSGSWLANSYKLGADENSNEYKRFADDVILVIEQQLSDEKSGDKVALPSEKSNVARVVSEVIKATK